MKSTTKNKLLVLLLFASLLLLSFICWAKPATEYSDSERRALAAFPQLNAETFFSGKFMSEFETYTLDQFPFRDTFRGLKSGAALFLFRQSTVNDLYLQDGYISKAEYPLSQPMIDNAAKKFRFLYDNYMADTDVNIYLSVVPDKNYFISAENGRLSMDYAGLTESLIQQSPYMEYIDIFPSLSLEDYYQTDTHWKQEMLLPTARLLTDAMGTEISTEYHIHDLNSDFYGVYYGQLALPISPDEIRYLTNDILDACIVTSYNTGKPVLQEMYDLSKADSKDPYEMFVCGNDALVTIENPNATTDKELIVFRDSFGSSIAPLLATGYRKVTLVDIRYIHSAMLGAFIEFHDQDVLFLYSTLVLNSSTSFK